MKYDEAFIHFLEALCPGLELDPILGTPSIHKVGIQYTVDITPVHRTCTLTHAFKIRQFRVDNSPTQYSFFGGGGKPQESCTVTTGAVRQQCYL